MAIKLTTSHGRLWWLIDEGDAQPEQWDLSADVWPLEVCAPELRHVGDIRIAQADLGETRNLLDTLTVHDWALEFIAETVLEPPKGTLHPDLDATLTVGPPRMLVLRNITLTEPWRGLGLGGPLIASALRLLAPSARLAVCRVRFRPPTSKARRATGFGRAGQCPHGSTLLERIGFRRWRDVHIVDLADPALLGARSALFDQWGPKF